MSLVLRKRKSFPLDLIEVGESRIIHEDKQEAEWGTP